MDRAATFFCINIWTDQYKEAFSGNTYQFIDEAKRDGFLQAQKQLFWF